MLGSAVGADTPCVAVEDMHTNRGGLGIGARPARVHGGGVIMRGAVRQVHRRAAIQNGAGDLADPIPGLRLADALGDAVTGLGELALVFLACALMDHTADTVGEAAALDAVHDHFGNGELALDGFTARFEIKRFGKAFPLRAARGCVLGVQPGCVVDCGVAGHRGHQRCQV